MGSGDYTLEAVEQAIQDITIDNSDREELDEYIVVAISDANLARYGIHPRELGKVSRRCERTIYIYIYIIINIYVSLSLFCAQTHLFICLFSSH